jgi:hypothetical protein
MSGANHRHSLAACTRAVAATGYVRRRRSAACSSKVRDMVVQEDRDKAIVSWVGATLLGPVTGAAAFAVYDARSWRSAAFIAGLRSAPGRDLLAGLALGGALLLVVAVALGSLLAALDLLALRLGSPVLPRGRPAWLASSLGAFALAAVVDPRHAALQLAIDAPWTMRLWAVTLVVLGVEVFVARRAYERIRRARTGERF